MTLITDEERKAKPGFLLLSVPQPEGDPLELHAVPMIENEARLTLALDVRRSGKILSATRAWWRNSMWTLRTDVTVRNAELAAVAALVQEGVLRVADDLWLPRDAVLEAVSPENMSNVAVLMEVMGSMILAECPETGWSVRLAPASGAVWLNVYLNTEWVSAETSFRWTDGHWYVSVKGRDVDEFGFRNTTEDEMTPYGVALKVRALIRERGEWPLRWPDSFDTAGLIELLSPERMGLVSPVLEVMES